MKSSQQIVNPSPIFLHDNKTAQSTELNTNKWRGSGSNGKNIVLSKIILRKDNNRERQLSQKASSQFIYNSQQNQQTQTQVRDANQTLSEPPSLQFNPKIQVPQSASPTQHHRQATKFELDYRKMQKNTMDSYNSYQLHHADTQLLNRQLGLSVLLGHSLKNIKQLDIDTHSLIQSTNNNKNKGKKTSKDRNNSIIPHKIQRQREYIRKLEQYQPNMYRLLEYNQTSKNQLPFAQKCISLEFLNELTNDSHRFNTLYGQYNEQAQNKELMLNQDYLKQRQLNSKFIDMQVGNIMSQHIGNYKYIGNDREYWENQISRVILSQFCGQFKFGNQLEVGVNRTHRVNKKFLTYQEINNSLDQRILAFGSSFEYFQTSKPNEMPFQKQYEQLAKEAQHLAQNYRKNESNTQPKFSSDKQNLLQQFTRQILCYFTSTAYSPNKIDDQYSAFLQYKQQVTEKVDKKYQEIVRNRINGQMIYEVEDKIMDIKINKQIWVKCVFNIVRNKKRVVDKSIRLGNRQIRPQPQPQIMKTKPNIEILRKMKYNQQNLYMPTNKSVSYSNLRGSRVGLNITNAREKLPRLPDLGNLNNLNYTNNNTPEYAPKKNKKNMREQKKQQLNDYINKLCNKNPATQSQTHRNTNSISSQSLNNRSNKYIKYSKYPLKFGDAVQFNSQNPETCAIVYDASEINVKQLTLKFMRDRRMYGVNQVVIRLNPSSASETQEDKRKAIKILQILSCLGARVRVERAMPYRMLEQKNSVSVEIIAFALRENVQKIWQIFQK